MSTVGNAAADALNNLIAALNTGGNTTMKYKAEDIMEQVKNMQKLSESTNNLSLIHIFHDIYYTQIRCHFFQIQFL